MITKEYLNERIKNLCSAYDNQVERLHNTAGAIQEARFLLQKIEEKEKADAAFKKGGKKK